MQPEDWLYVYRQSTQLEGQTGCIGHLRGDFGDGQEFYSSWFDHHGEYKTNEFKAEYPDVRFVDIHSSYRSIAKPTLRFVDVIAKRAEARNYSTTVLVPQFIPKHPWQLALHNQTSVRLRAVLNSRENIIVASYNYHLHE